MDYYIKKYEQEYRAYHKKDHEIFKFWKNSMKSEEPTIFIGNSYGARTADCLHFSRAKKLSKPKKIMWLQTATNTVILTW